MCVGGKQPSLHTKRYFCGRKFTSIAMFVPRCVPLHSLSKKLSLLVLIMIILKKNKIKLKKLGLKQNFLKKK